MKSYLDSKFSSIKRELSDSFTKEAKKSKILQHSSFKYKSNEKQMEFNNKIIKALEDVARNANLRSKKK